MHRHVVSFCLVLGLAFSSSSSMALSDSYYSTGEDIDFLIESDNMTALLEIEYELRKFVVFRKIEDYVFSMTDTFSQWEE